MKTVITIFFFLTFSIITMGQVDVTPASGGTDLDRSISSANGVPGGYASLGNVIIQETQIEDFNKNSDPVLTLSPPNNWQFKPATGGIAFEAGRDVTSATINITASSITININQPNGTLSAIDIITISGLQVQAIDGSIAPAAGYIFASSVSGITGITTGTSGTNFGSLSLDASTPLPVELTSFAAIIRDNSVDLKWVTETEVNNYGFEIQRSTISDKWEILGFLEGNGNSNSQNHYNFVDSEVSPSGIYSYRLKQIDNGGAFVYSKTIEVSFNSLISFELMQNYPNPFNPSTTISFTLPESGNVSLNIFNPLGERITTLVNGYTESGVHTFNFNAENLPSGMYIYQLNTTSNTITKKMLFLK